MDHNKPREMMNGNVSILREALGGGHQQLGEVPLFNTFINGLEEGGNHTLMKTGSNNKSEGVASASKENNTNPIKEVRNASKNNKYT